MADVRAAFGDPIKEIDVATWGFKRMHFGDEKNATIWIYLFASGSAFGANSKNLEVDFDKTGTVSDYFYNSTYGEDKIKNLKDSELKDFDIFEAKKKIIPHKTERSEVLAFLGPHYREIIINKPGTKDRWFYHYKEESKDEKITIGRTWIGPIEVNAVYKKDIAIDFNENNIVAGVRGESSFPADKDKFFTK